MTETTKLLPCPICNGIMDCLHSLAERKLHVTADALESAQKDVERLRRDCAEAYQVVGTMRGHCPDEDAIPIIKALDNLSAAAAGEPRPHNDLLPFILPEPEAALKAQVEGMRQLVKAAYNEGFCEGMNEYQKPRSGGKPWTDSTAFKKLAALGEKP